MKCFGALDQVSRVLSADGTAPPMAAIHIRQGMAARDSLEQPGFAQPAAGHRVTAAILIARTFSHSWRFSLTHISRGCGVLM